MSAFTSPPNRIEFDQRVWELVRKVPQGRVLTYGRIAELLAAPEGVKHETYRAFGARWVGSSMANCPEDVPWQRVINSQGMVSVRKGSSGHLRQRALLEAEGVIFNESGRISLKEYLWDPDAEWEQKRLF
jgi:methylated-DNA-protein-cysteine methyltransferase-like protein